ncbi:MAG: hypothetical protein JRN68_03700 [Nitrososphaerota archaeon]|nr:hypothetical protein [Nitrososphaerota archaeon]
MSISIKDVDGSTFRNSKAEAARAGMKLGEAASEAFRMWVDSRRLQRLRDKEKMLEAARQMDALRNASKGKWSGVAEIRKWRDLKK